jgi:uncharacterized protein YcfJ
MRMAAKSIFFVSLLSVLIGCAQALTPREQGALGGGALGAGAGAMVGKQLGNTGTGAAIGAGAGALTGIAVGEAQQRSLSREEQKRQQREAIYRQELEIKRQRQEVEDLRRQQYYNELLR